MVSWYYVSSTFLENRISKQVSTLHNVSDIHFDSIYVHEVPFTRLEKKGHRVVVLTKPNRVLRFEVSVSHAYSLILGSHNIYKYINTRRSTQLNVEAFSTPIYKSTHIIHLAPLFLNIPISSLLNA
ncbi:hypothetical protein ABKN59_004448 [Abortiporus biennis]